MEYGVGSCAAVQNIACTNECIDLSTKICWVNFVFYVYYILFWFSGKQQIRIGSVKIEQTKDNDEEMRAIELLVVLGGPNERTNE